jgi:hypothetical protein
MAIFDALNLNKPLSDRLRAGRLITFLGDFVVPALDSVATIPDVRRMVGDRKAPFRATSVSGCPRDWLPPKKSAREGTC